MQKYIHNKKRFSDKSVLIKQVIGEEPAAEEGEIIYAMSPLGGFLTQERETVIQIRTIHNHRMDKRRKNGNRKQFR